MPAGHTLRAAMALGLALGLGAAACATAPPPASEPVTESPPGDKPMTIRGQLTSEGVECPAMRGDDGSLYTLLGDLGGLKPGERVLVEGTPVAISICMQGTTLQVTRITRRN